MKVSSIYLLLFIFIFIRQAGFTQNTDAFNNISLNNLDFFRNPGKNWIISSDAAVDYLSPLYMKPISGTGIVVNIPENANRSHLFTKEEFGDLELELDFMMAKNSNSGVYFQGRYEIQLLDSWTRLQASASDAGGIYLRWAKERGIFEGTPPLMNVARAPGLWQHLLVRFRAPRFNDKGEKISNARFDQVFLNGVLVQQQSQVTGPTGSAMFQDEKPTGPLVLQGDHGPVAFRNLKYRPLKPLVTTFHRQQHYKELISPILIKPDGYPYILRSFMYFGDKKLAYVVSVGNASQVHYSYDLKRGALFQVWRGEFADATPMWRERGEEQVFLPMGSLISLSDAPTLAILTDDKAAWPDSIDFDHVQPHGYTLDKQRSPIFRYSINDTEVRDSIAVMPAREGITRTLTMTGALENLYCRIGTGKVIENLNGDLYAINGKSYYLRIDKKFNPIVRQSAGDQEIIVKYDPTAPLTYSIIW